MPFVVALQQLSASSPALAPLLGITVYEANQKLAAGLPAVLTQTPDRARAIELVTQLRAAGHDAVVFDAAAVVDLAQMTVLRDFHFEPHALTLQGIDGRTLDELPWADVHCLVRAVDRTGERVTRTEKETTLSAARIIVSGGLLATKTNTKEITSNTEAREGILVMFRRSGAAPWILRETAARYGALEHERAATTLQNFMIACARIRSLSNAPYDERLLTRRARGDELGLLVHLLAMRAAAP